MCFGVLEVRTPGRKSVSCLALTVLGTHKNLAIPFNSNQARWERDKISQLDISFQLQALFNYFYVFSDPHTTSSKRIGKITISIVFY